ncbi:MAG: Zn-ribbon domain-containing OB-fold protein [Candidatus Kariarchaeaceae archaeon]|jgi:uncharacterized OB-fold protein
MLPTRRNIHDPPTREILGGFPVHYLYTVGISGEKFFKGLKDQKILGNTCNACNMTYLPPKMFCEDCFDELGEGTYKELGTEGELVSFSQVFYDHRGDKLSDPYFLGLIKVDGSNTTFFHKLLNSSEPKIGMRVKAVWNSERIASIFDLQGFEPS